MATQQRGRQPQTQSRQAPPPPTRQQAARQAPPKTQSQTRKAAPPPPPPEEETEEYQDPGFADVEQQDAGGGDQDVPPDEQQGDQQDDNANGETQEYADLVGGMNLQDPNLKPSDGAFQLAPAGDFPWEITAAVRKPAKSSGQPMVEVTFAIASGEHTGVEAKSWYLIKPESQFWRGRMLALTSATRVPMDRNGNFSIRALVGRRLMATVIHETQEGVNPETGEPTKQTRARFCKERPMPKAKGQNGQA